MSGRESRLTLVGRVRRVLAILDMPNLSISRLGLPGEDGSGPGSVDVVLNCRYGTLNLLWLAE